MNIWLERSQSLQCLYFSWHEAVHISEILSAQRLGSIHSPSGKPNLHMAFKSAPAGVRTVTLLRRLNMALGLCPTERTRSAARSTSTASGITNAKCRVDYLTTISIKDGIPPAKTTSEFQIQSPLLKLSKIQVVHLFFSIEGALGMQARQCSQCMPAKKERENRVHYRPRSTPHLKIQLPSL